MFTLKINTDNAAFDDSDKELEIARILKEVIRDLESGDYLKRYTIRDINGNIVGEYELC